VEKFARNTSLFHCTISSCLVLRQQFSVTSSHGGTLYTVSRSISRYQPVISNDNDYAYARGGFLASTDTTPTAGLLQFQALSRLRFLRQLYFRLVLRLLGMVQLGMIPYTALQHLKIQSNSLSGPRMPMPLCLCFLSTSSHARSIQGHRSKLTPTANSTTDVVEMVEFSERWAVCKDGFAGHGHGRGRMIL